MGDPPHDVIEQHNRTQLDYFERAGKHAMQPSDSHYIRRQVDRLIAFAELSPGARVLDAGCGMGRYTFALADHGLAVEGLDLSPSLLEQFRRFDAGRYNIPVHCADVLDPPAELRCAFDAVIGFFTLHHLFDLAGSLRAMRALSKPGGRIVFLEPNPLKALCYVQMLVAPGMSWKGDKGILQMREATVFRAMRDAGLRNPTLERFGFLPPFLVNRAWGPRAESTLERFRPLARVLPFQLFRGDISG
jgi:SAM-dependent methyltransferase